MEEEPRKRVSTRRCVDCLGKGKEVFLNFQYWGGDQIRWDCRACGNTWTEDNKMGHGGDITGGWKE